jgi:type VI protein secretion system component VasF
LPLSSIIYIPEYEHLGMYSTTSGSTNDVNTFLQVPIIFVVLLAVALLTTFYLWLRYIEKRHSEN